MSQVYINAGECQKRHSSRYRSLASLVECDPEASTLDLVNCLRQVYIQWLISSLYHECFCKSVNVSGGCWEIDVLRSEGPEHSGLAWISVFAGGRQLLRIGARHRVLSRRPMEFTRGGQIQPQCLHPHGLCPIRRTLLYGGLRQCSGQGSESLGTHLLWPRSQRTQLA